jgi:hypothetical protein
MSELLIIACAGTSSLEYKLPEALRDSDHVFGLPTIDCGSVIEFRVA